jgi:uncharacterized membrane protein
MSALSSEQAAAAGALIVMACAVVDTLVEGTVILRVHGAKEPLDEKQLMKGVRLGTDRTFEQDPRYAIRLLVDIAIKALSPVINDPTTAVHALDQIEDLLLRLGDTTWTTAMPPTRMECPASYLRCRPGRIISRSPSMRYVSTELDRSG